MDQDSISLNGSDDSGKSTQIKLLSLDCGNFLHPTKPLISYSERWTQARGVEMSKWWFEEIRPEILADIIIESLNRRNADRVIGKMQLHDRGWQMFKAVCVATWATRDYLMDFQETARTVNEMFLKGLDYEPREMEILLIPNQDYFMSIKPILEASRRPGGGAFPEHIEARYLRYQDNLRAAMKIYFSRPAVLSIDVDKPICDIQNRIRKLISQSTGIDFAKLADELRVLVGFSGLSESGKSSFAEHLRKNLAFTRLKLRYFIELLERRGAKRTDEEIVLELLLFLRRHYYIDRLSIESLHDPYIPAILKLMIGERFKLIYLETSKTTRANRVCAQSGNDASAERILSEIEVKDKVKVERGILTIPQIADLVLDNNSEDFDGNIRSLLSNLSID